jgi:hypothetical protein
MWREGMHDTVRSERIEDPPIARQRPDGNAEAVSRRLAA